MRKILQITAVAAATVVAVAVTVAAYLAYPGKPANSKFVRFEGYIKLPRHGSLNVLDYLTLQGHTLFVTSESSGSVFKVILNPGHPSASTVSEMLGGGATHGVALLPNRNIAFVTRSEKNTVDAFNPDTLQRMARIPVADDADSILYDSVAKLVYVASGEPKLATLIDPDKLETVGTIALGGKPEFEALDLKTDLLYQNLEDISAIAAIDLGKRSVVGQWQLAPCQGPSGMAIDSTQRRLFAVCSVNALMVVFNLDTHQVVASLPVGGGPDSVALDPSLHRIYVAGKAGALTVIQRDSPDSYHVLDNVHTHYGAHTLAVDPISHNVYVGYASLFAHPRIAVFSAMQ